ncbi:MAG TPA: IPT/TIG domain-containing protein [Puia sp.]|nr:IPT/TIG domain-containing protein [Puia sp.]
MKLPFLPFAAAVLIVNAIGCVRTQIPIPHPPTGTSTGPLSITSISPTHGAGGSDIHLIGTGFSTTLIYDTVKINGIAAVVTSASDTELVVTIPVKAGSGAIAINTGGKTTTGPTLTYDTTWIVSTVAGTTKGFSDGAIATAQFNQPYGLCLDKAGNMYVADMSNYRVRKISTNGQVTTLAGGTYGTADGIGTAAQFDMPTSVAVDNNGKLYITDSYGNRVTKYDPSTQAVTTIAGGTEGKLDGPALSAQLFEPNGIAVTPDGQYVFWCEVGNNNVRILSGGVVSTIAGNTCYSGHTDGPSRIATFQTPWALCLDANYNVYVADSYSQAIRRIAAGGAVTTIAGDTTRQGSKDGIGRAAQFFAPAGICLAPNGNLYVADSYNNEIRQVTMSGVVSTIAGSTTPGNVDGPGTSARFNLPWGMAVDSQGALYVADSRNHTIRKLVWQ